MRKDKVADHEHRRKFENLTKTTDLEETILLRTDMTLLHPLRKCVPIAARLESYFDPSNSIYRKYVTKSHRPGDPAVNILFRVFPPQILFCDRVATFTYPCRGGDHDRG